MADFKSLDDVQGWVDANGVEALRHAVVSGRFGSQNKHQAEAWLNTYDRAQVMQEAETNRALYERSVSAAEQSAKAARSSAKWAMWAVIIAVVAIIVSVSQFLTSR